MNSILSLVLIVTERRDELIKKCCDKLSSPLTADDPTSPARLRMYVNNCCSRQMMMAMMIIMVVMMMTLIIMMMMMRMIMIIIMMMMMTIL